MPSVIKLRLASLLASLILVCTVIAMAIPVANTTADASPAETSASSPNRSAQGMISTGSQTTCVVSSTGGLKCWGEGVTGKLGNGTNLDSTTPVDVTGMTSGVAQVAVGFDHTCALTTSGGVKCWGQNRNVYGNYGGQLGNGTFNHSNTPVNVVGLSSGVTQIVVGQSWSCALTNTGGVKCWGLQGDSVSLTVPVEVPGMSSGIIGIEAGYSNICGITSSGGIKCIGHVVDGRLSNSMSYTSSLDVPQLSVGVEAFTLGYFHACFVMSSTGGVKCWGNNNWRQLGVGSQTGGWAPYSSNPSDVIGLSSGAVSISAGGQHTCVITTSSTVKCWGSNDAGQLGNGSITTQTAVVTALNLSNVIAISSGDNYTCALLQDNSVKCWGGNGKGQLGDGTTTARWEPGLASVLNFNVGPTTTTTTTTTTVPRTTTTVPATTTTIATTVATTVATSPTTTVSQGQASVATIAPTTTVAASTSTRSPTAVTQQSATTTTTVAATTSTSTAPTNQATIAGPNAPTAELGQTGATLNGYEVLASLVRKNNTFEISSAGVTATIGATSNGVALALNSNGNLVVPTGASITVSAKGYTPNEPVELWLYSTPTKLMDLIADKNGAVSTQATIPANISEGNHRLVLNGVSTAGDTVVIGVGIAVGVDNSPSSISRALIAIPVALAIFVGLALPTTAARRRRRRNAIVKLVND